MRRPVRVGLMMSWLAGSAVAQSAAPAPQTRSPQMPRLYRGVETLVGGIFVTPVPNAPFLATVEIVSHQKLADGGEHVTTTTNHIARTASGRIYNERRQMVSTDYKGEPALLSAHIYDPGTRQSIFLNPETHLARAVTLRAPEPTPERALPPALQAARESTGAAELGTKSLDGVELSGTRRQYTVPALASGTGKPVVVTDDYWYSPELSIYMIIRHDDPRTGEQLVAVTKVERAEPPAELLTVPARYKLVDETTDEAPVAVR